MMIRRLMKLGLSLAAVAGLYGLSNGLHAAPTIGATPAAPAGPVQPAALTVQPGRPTRIAVADPTKIFAQIKEVQVLKAQVQQENQEYIRKQKELSEAADSLKKDVSQLKYGSPQAEDTFNQFNEATAKLQSYMATQRARAEHLEKRQTVGLMTKIQAAINEIATRDGYDLVVSSTEEQIPEGTNIDGLTVQQVRAIFLNKIILYSNDKVDITKKVIDDLDAKFNAGQ